jgi:hypothetical protein
MIVSFENAAAEHQQTDYSNALNEFDEAAHGQDVFPAPVLAAYAALLAEARNNPLGQDVVRDAAEVLADTSWALSENSLTVVVRPVEVRNVGDVEDFSGFSGVEFEYRVVGSGEWKAGLEYADKDGDLVIGSESNLHSHQCEVGLSYGQVEMVHGALLEALDARRRNRQASFFVVDCGYVTAVERFAKRRIDWNDNALCYARDAGEALALAKLYDGGELEPMFVTVGGETRVAALVPKDIRHLVS